MMSKGNVSSALSAARQALGIDAESPEVHNLLGCIYAMDGDREEALSCYKKAMDLDENYLDPLLNTVELLINEKINPEEAIGLCRKAQELVESDEELVEVVLLEADALLSFGKIDDARKALSRIENLNYTDTVHYSMVGRALLEAGDIEKSKEIIEKGIKENPDSADMWYCKGLLLREQGRRIDAVEAFLNVLEKDEQTFLTSSFRELSERDTLVSSAIALMDEEAREMLKNTQIHFVSHPTREQVMDEVDPRQAVLAEGVNIEFKSFINLWIFYGNFEHAGLSLVSPEFGLAEIIKDELIIEHLDK